MSSCSEATPARADATIKEHKSGKDFLVNPLGDGAVDDRNVEHAAPAKASDTGRETQKYNFGGEGIFSIDDITCGVEICYDHNMQRLRRSSVARGEARVQVQIIPSAGANIEAKGVVALAGGPVFNCDGLYGTGAGAHPDGISGHSRLCTVTTASFAKTAAFTQVAARRFEQSASVDTEQRTRGRRRVGHTAGPDIAGAAEIGHQRSTDASRLSRTVSLVCPHVRRQARLLAVSLERALSPGVDRAADANVPLGRALAPSASPFLTICLGCELARGTGWHERCVGPAPARCSESDEERRPAQWRQLIG